jgi:arylsulfatase A-like enzyme
MLTRREFVGAAAAAAGRRRPNILFVFADQLRSFEVGCYGAEAPRTPHIDRLASEGVRFTNAVSTFPVCSPFRAMLMTGLYPMANGMTVNDHRLNANVPSVAGALKRAGYQTGYIGKWHLDGHGRENFTPKERRLGFDFWMALECTHNYFRSLYYAGDSDQPRYWEGYDAVDQTRAACQYIREQARQGPFALFMSWGPPHNPYIAPDEYMRRFDPAKMRLRPNVGNRGAFEFLAANTKTKLPPEREKARANARRQWSDENHIRKCYAGYYAAIECLDDMIGELRKTLAGEGILDDTIFVFTSDHGDMLGSHGLADKTVPFEEAISIPFLIRYPRRIRGGRVTDALLAPIDMMPTLLALAGVGCPRVDGMDLSGAATGEGGRERDALLLMQMTPAGNSWVLAGTEPWRGVRTKTHTYVRFADGRPWALFDNQKDRYQTDNLIDRSSHSALRNRMEKRLRELLEEAKDPCDTRRIIDEILRVQPDHALIRSARLANPGIL